MIAPSKPLLDILARSVGASRTMASYYRSGDATQRAVALRRACLHLLANEAHDLEAEERALVLAFLADLEAESGDR